MTTIDGDYEIPGDSRAPATGVAVYGNGASNGSNGHNHHHASQPRTRCCRRDVAPRILTAGLSRLGLYVGRYPYFFIFGALTLTLIYGTAILRNMVYITDIEYLYIPTNAQSWYDRTVAEEFFPVNFSGRFQPDRATRFGSFAHVLLYPKDGRSVLRRDCFDEVLKVDAMVRNISIPLPKVSAGGSTKYVKYADLCARWDNDCFFSDTVKLANTIDDIERGTVNLTFPTFFDEAAFDYIILPGSIGMPELDGDRVVSAPAVGLFFILKASTEEEIALGRAWEIEYVRQMGEIAKKLEVVDVYYESSDSVEIEFDNLKTYVPFQGILAGTIVCIFSVFCCMMTDWVRAKPMLAGWGVLSTVLATICAYGFLMSIGLPFTTTLFITPFLMLGIGMDDTFLMLAAWRKTSVHASVEQRIAETYAEAAVSMTITSITNVVSFLIGATTPFRVLNIFCVYSGISILFLYLFQITFFGGFLTIYGRLEKANRHSVTGQKIMTLAEAEKRGKNRWFKLLYTGGQDESEAGFNDKEGATDHALMSFFRDKVAIGLTKTPVRIGVLFLFLAYLAGGIYGVFQIEEGLSLKRLVPDYSYYVQFYDRRYKDFMDYPYRVPIVLTGQLDYSNETVQDDIERMLTRVEDYKFYAGANFTDSWLRKLLRFAELANEHANVVDLSNETSFNANVKGLLMSGENNKNSLDVVFDEDGHIIASRFVVQIYNLTGLHDLKDCMLFLRETFKTEFPQYNLTAFTPVFSFGELLIGATNVAVQTVGMAAIVMLIIALIMIPESKCALYVGFSLVSIELGVLGYMALWGVNLDAVSVGCLVMCIGFSVDFSAHITHSFISSGESTSTSIERLQDAVEKAGLPILQGAASSILGVAAMSQIPAYAFIIFVKTVLLVMVFGAVHGILFLPIILVMTDSSGKKQEPTKDTHLSHADKAGRGDENDDKLKAIFAPAKTEICLVGNTEYSSVTLDSFEKMAPINGDSIGSLTAKGVDSYIDEDDTLTDERDDAEYKQKGERSSLLTGLARSVPSLASTTKVEHHSGPKRTSSHSSHEAASSCDGSTSGIATDEAPSKYSASGSAEDDDDDEDAIIEATLVNGRSKPQRRGRRVRISSTNIDSL